MNKKHLVVPVLTGLLVIAWVVLIYLPTSEQIKLLDTRMQELITRQSNSVSVLDVSMLRTRVDSLTAGVQRRMASFYPEKKLLELGRTMDQIGKKYNLNLISISPDHESLSLFSSAQTISELPVSLEYTGRFFDLAKYLDDMPEFPIAFRMKQMDIKKDEEVKFRLSVILKGVIIISNNPEEETELIAS